MSEPEPEPGLEEPLELTPALRPPWWAWAAVGAMLLLDLRWLADLMNARAWARMTEQHVEPGVELADGLLERLERWLES